jgi:hypothetical protein
MKARFLARVVAATLVVLLAQCGSTQAAAPDKAKQGANKKLVPMPGNFPMLPGIQFPAFPGFPVQGLPMVQIQGQPGAFPLNLGLIPNGQQQQQFDNLDDFLAALKNMNFDPEIIRFFQNALPKK